MHVHVSQRETEFLQDMKHSGSFIARPGDAQNIDEDTFYKHVHEVHH
jgi:hypothetical protein